VQQFLEAARITLEHKFGGQSSTSLVEEEHTPNIPMTELAVGCRTLQIEIDTVKFPIPKLQEQMKKLIQLNILVLHMPIHILQILQIGIFHENKLHVDEVNR
jgi:hypothetical protein